MEKTTLVIQANQLLKSGNFEYAIAGGRAIDLFLKYESRTHSDIDIAAFRYDRDRIIQFMWSQGFLVYEMLGGGKVHRITDISEQKRRNGNLCCFLENCSIVKVYPPDGDDCCWFEFFHTGQTELDYVEFLFNDRSENHWEYAPNRGIRRELRKAILFSDDIPYLSPEICLLYKSADTEREGYQKDFELAYCAMDIEQKKWLYNMLRKMYPQGHKWLSYMQGATEG